MDDDLNFNSNSVIQDIGWTDDLQFCSFQQYACIRTMEG